MPQHQGLGKNYMWTPWKLQTHLRATSHHLSHHCWGEGYLVAVVRMKSAQCARINHHCEEDER